MKRIKQGFSLLLAVALLLLCVPRVPLTAKAATPVSGTAGELAWTLDGEGTLTVSGTGIMPDYTKDGDAPWYSSRGSIKKAVISSGVTTIGSAAFYKCESLEEVSIPATVTRIGDAAFMSCSELKSATIPDSVTYLGVDAFCYCSSLASVELSDNLTAIEDGAFDECLSLTQITIPDSVKYIGEYAFGACPLTELVIPEGVTRIGQGAFTYCEQLATISFPDSLVRIGYEVFYNTAWEEALPMGPVYAGKVLYTYRGDCPETLTVKDGTVGIGDSAIFNQTTLKEVILPDSLVSIGLTSFFKCTGLTSIELPDSLTTIEEDAFQQCSNLAEISFPDSLTWVGNCAFMSTAWYNAQPDGPVYTGKVLYKYKGTCPEFVTVQDGTVAIGDGAFNSADRLISVEFPDSVTTIGFGAFWHSGLSSVELPKGLTTIGGDAFFGCDKLTAVTIPDSVVYIGTSAFHDCDSLRQVTIGSSVRTIDNSAFALCNQLESLTIPASVQEIGTAALVCQGMTEITFEGAAPRFCVGVDGDAEPIFMGVTATAYYHPDATWTNSVLQNYGGTITWVPLTTGPAIVASGTCGDHLTWTLDEEGTLTISGTGTMYDYEYAGVDSPWYRDYRTFVKKIVIEDGVTTIGEYAFNRFENLTQIQIGKDLASIGKKAISMCYSMAAVTVDPGNAQFSSNEEGVLFNKDKSTLVYYPISKVGAYVIPNTVKTIGNYAFAYCTGLTGITIPDSVTTIEGSPFYSCTGLTEVVVPDSVVTMGGAFQDCENLTKVTIGNSVTGIAMWTLFGCTKMKTLELGNSITAIREEACFALYDLENVTFPETLTTIGDRAFGSCTSMTKITIPAAVTSIGVVAFGNCTKVTEIYFDGSAPTIGINAFANVTATAYYYPDSTWTDEVMQNYGGTITWVPLEPPGDLDGDNEVTDADVIYLLWHTVFPEDYPLNGKKADFDGDNMVTDADVIYLLWHTVFPEDYPLR